MDGQQVIVINGDFAELDECLSGLCLKKILLVCGHSIELLNIGVYFRNLERRKGIEVVIFDKFSPNPQYSSVVEGIKFFKEEHCDSIVAVGGGSAIDVAKCIKLYSRMNESSNLLKQSIISNDIKLIAVPTTAGTGSEATRYAVIYYNGEKQSISDYSCIPSVVVIDPMALKTLPIYQRKSTMMDAFCHAIESLWSINSNNESREYSRRAIRAILKYKDAYLNNKNEGNLGMLYASNISGKAINITQTTAGHAMCYKLTSLYGLAHGHAAALCVSKLWPYMIAHIGDCIDPRGVQYLNNIFLEIAYAMRCKTSKEAIAYLDGTLYDLSLEVPILRDKYDFEILKNSVNTARLENNPVKLDIGAIDDLYHQIMKY